jgi:hypothetical protein
MTPKKNPVKGVGIPIGYAILMWASDDAGAPAALPEVALGGEEVEGGSEPRLELRPRLIAPVSQLSVPFPTFPYWANLTPNQPLCYFPLFDSGLIILTKGPMFCSERQLSPSRGAAT